jgi:uncharacterized protein (TIGR02145 family)
MKIWQTNLIFLALFCVATFAQQKGTFTDTRDGKKYKTTKIGEQVWMAENLNYKVNGSKCYGEDDEEITLSSSEMQANCDKYGRLYDWATAMKACPNGWHLPSNAEWDKLYRFADGTSGTESPYKSETAGKYLKSKEGWKKSGNGEDKFGFSALPGGFGSPSESFFHVGGGGHWWSGSFHSFGDSYLWGDSFSVYGRYMGYGYEYALLRIYIEFFLFSVRCVED